MNSLLACPQWPLLPRAFAFAFLSFFLLLSIASTQAVAAPVDVRIVDAVTAAAMPGAEIQAYEVTAAGARVWLAKQTSNSIGVATFQLEGLGAGRSYQFDLRPFLQSVRSDVVSQPGEVLIRAGKLQVRLVDGRDGSAFANQSVFLL
ncbi:hypothetical protein NMQ14_18575, partial [Methyloversatilis sp. XJ19-13]|uniref:hypothetical protein n=1 Tax=Methyloversatilis sp. XJ19-13 TaxID=2963430 RepID=UPI00211C10A3